MSFGFGHTWGLPVGDLPRKGLWRLSHAGVGNGRFFEVYFAEKWGFGVF
jgi:hypothetical protein